MAHNSELEAALQIWRLGDKLQRLAILAPEDVRAIEAIIDDALRNRWPSLVLPFRPSGQGSRIALILAVSLLGGAA